MTIYRYEALTSGILTSSLIPSLPPGAAYSYLDTIGPTLIDIDVAANLKDDLDVAMTRVGYSFREEAPVLPYATGVNDIVVIQNIGGFPSLPAFDGSQLTGINTAPGVSLLAFDYKFSNTTTDSDPGKGRVRFNNSTQALTTQIYVDNRSQDNSVLTNFLRIANSGDLIIVQQKDNGINWHGFIINQTGVLTGSVNNGYMRYLDVSPLASGESIGNNKDVIFSLVFNNPAERYTDAEAITAIGGVAGTGIGNLVVIEDVGGLPGLPSLDGSQLTGVSGSPGSQGEIGPSGLQGDQGIQGPPGVGGSADSLKNIITVSPSGGNFTSIKSALDSITDSTFLNSYEVQVGPGIYSENPMISPGNVYVIANGPATIIANNQNEPLMQISGVAGISVVNGITFIGPTNSEALTFLPFSSGRVEGVTFRDAGVGLTLLDESRTLCVSNAFLGITTSKTGLIIDGGVHSIFSSAFARLDTAIDCHGGIVDISTATIRYAQIGLKLHDTAQISLSAVDLEACQTGLYIEETANGSVSARSLEFSGERLMDLYVASTGIPVGIWSTRMRGDKTFSANWAFTQLHYFDDKEGDAGERLLAELTVGSPEIGRECSFGGGDSYTRGMMVYQSGVGSGTLVDVSAIAAVINSATFGFPALTSGNAIYISSDLNKTSTGDKVKFLGFKSLNETLMVLNGGMAICEYYNGNWVPLTAMSTEADNSYMHYGNEVFQNVTREQVRFDSRAINNWVKNDPINDGTDRYWMRFKIVSDIMTSPQIQQIKLHTSKTEVNDDGYIEYFGQARPFGLIPFDIGQINPAAASPSNQDLFLSDTLDVGRTENLFQSTATDRIGLVNRAPADLDTSSPIVFIFTWMNVSVGAGDVRWVIRYSWSTDGESVYTSTGGAPTTHVNQAEVEVIVPTSGRFIQTTAEALLDLSQIRTRRPTPEYSDLLWISIERDGGHVLDTYGGHAALIQITPKYLKWNNGGHIA